MGRSAALLVLALCPAWAWGQVVPGEVTGEPGAIVTVPADVPEGTPVAWYAPDPGLSMVPPALLRDGRTAVLIAPKAGSYRLVAFYGDDGGRVNGPHVCLVKIGTPPGPEPGPGPGPDDPLVAGLRAAYAAERSPAKGGDVSKLAELYRRGAGIARRPDIDTAGELFAALRAGAVEMGLVGKLNGVQTVIQAELVKHLPTDPKAGFDPAMAAGVFGRVADALGALE